MAPAFAFGGPEIQRGLLEEEGVPFLPDGGLTSRGRSGDPVPEREIPDRKAAEER